MNSATDLCYLRYILPDFQTSCQQLLIAIYCHLSYRKPKYLRPGTAYTVARRALSCSPPSIAHSPEDQSDEDAQSHP